MALHLLHFIYDKWTILDYMTGHHVTLAQYYSIVHLHHIITHI